MDLGIDGKTALVAASSAGLDRACATAPAREGCTETINGRDARAYLCSAQAGFISGQNLQLDGGSYPGLISASTDQVKSVIPAQAGIHEDQSVAGSLRSRG